MNIIQSFNPKESLKLIEQKDNFYLLKNLYLNNNFPKVLLLSGEHGSGKFTLINHFMHYYFDKDNYSEKENIILKKNNFFKQNLSNTFPNIYYLNGSDFKNIKIEDIRNLKNNLLKTPILQKKRFIILDNVEIFNLNSLNGLLKLIEEPGENNHFILVDNLSKNLLQTIKSRCLEIKIKLNEKSRQKIINFLSENFNQKNILDIDLIKTSPGNYIKFNYFFNEKILNLNESFLSNIKLILNLYKKDKNMFYKSLLIFITEYYLQKNRLKSLYNNNDYFNLRTSIIKKINDFFLYNLNQNTLLNSLEEKIK